jgi:hypothetical protein
MLALFFVFVLFCADSGLARGSSPAEEVHEILDFNTMFLIHGSRKGKIRIFYNIK